ncbi:MAG: chemotaxis protein CheA [Nitrospirae bacterium]|nr:chemotaxis protein CheA [Nitrospirota bacterium]
MKTSKKEFVAEAEDIIEAASISLLSLQGSFTPDALNSLFRAFHTMKGVSGLFGLNGITNLCHSLESLLDDIRFGRIELTDEAINFIFRNIDLLRRLISQTAGGMETDDTAVAVKEIESFRQMSKGSSGEVSLEDLGISHSILNVLSEYEEHRLKVNIRDRNGIYLVKSVFELASLESGLESLSASLKKIGDVIAILPSSEGVPDGSIGFTILFGSPSDTDAVKKTASAAGVEAIMPPKAHLSQPAEKLKDISLKSAATTVRVDIEKLDSILNTLAELTLTKDAVQRISRELAGTFGYTPLTMDAHRIGQTFQRKLGELKECILELRMVPFSQIFSRLSQVVRRYTRETGKDIEIEMFGGDTEIDKYIAEEIIDPLVHIVRNSIDHGIEAKEERISSGKKENGTVTIKAFTQGNNVVVTIHDDGAGINLEEVLKKAQKTNLVHEYETFKHKESINLIFLPGLSTKESVNEISGRGVGLDIARQKIVSLGGFIDVKTEVRKGTTFTITLPITLAIVKALIVGAAKERFAVPLTAISETFVIEPFKIQTIDAIEAVSLKGEMLPLIRLARVFHLKEEQNTEYFGVVVRAGERRFCFLVDEVKGRTEVVIKPLGGHLKNVFGISGAAEIGRHEVILVLDVESIVEEAFLSKMTGGR